MGFSKYYYFMSSCSLQKKFNSVYRIILSVYRIELFYGLSTPQLGEEHGSDYECRTHNL